ncbi:MAG: Ppx/GppA phosphatase family protein [Mariprofundus sp.]|nr:Ppx/GppA phosphatase family protein [Mariprofundus sp.]
MEIINLVEDDALPEPGAMVAAIDVGSNAIRMGVATRDADGMPRLIQRYREAVRLGHDAFTTGILSQQTMDDAVEAFSQFRRILDQQQIGTYRATATSAMRDSKNGAELVKRIWDKTNIKLQLISGEEEARLVHYSISRRVDLANKFTLLVDMGGGSVEITLCDNGEVIASQSFKIGTVRLLEMMGKGGDFNTLLSEYLDGMRKKIREQIGKRKADLCIATGGNAGAIGELAHQLLATESLQQINRKELGILIDEISVLTFEERVRDLGLRPDRADVILPATMVFYEIMALAGAKKMVMPDASLLDGIILDMMDGEERTFLSKRNNLIAWTRSLKRKYHVDQKYCKHVARLSLALFDQMAATHKLGHLERLLLEVAALVHEIGMYIRVGGHNRHAAYIISVSPLLGLSKHEKALLAQVVRYQRKAAPSEAHRDFTCLSTENQAKAWQLSALLRLGIALNKERRNRVHNIYVETDHNNITLHLEGDGDLMLERWAALQTVDYIKQAFDRKLHIDLNLNVDT